MDKRKLHSRSLAPWPTCETSARCVRPLRGLRKGQEGKKERYSVVQKGKPDDLFGERGRRQGGPAMAFTFRISILYAAISTCNGRIIHTMIRVIKGT